MAPIEQGEDPVRTANSVEQMFHGIVRAFCFHMSSCPTILAALSSDTGGPVVVLQSTSHVVRFRFLGIGSAVLPSEAANLKFGVLDCSARRGSKPVRDEAL